MPFHRLIDAVRFDANGEVEAVRWGEWIIGPERWPREAAVGQIAELLDAGRGPVWLSFPGQLRWSELKAVRQTAADARPTFMLNDPTRSISDAERL